MELYLVDVVGWVAWSYDRQHIAFTSSRDGNMEIYVINADGSGRTRLTDNQVKDQFPAWSPDGRRIAFTSGTDGSEAIYVMDADGNHKTRLTGHVGANFLVWSFDGQYLAFSSEGGKIVMMRADGSQLVTLPVIAAQFAWESLAATPSARYRTTGSANIRRNARAARSASAALPRLAFRSNGLYIVDADGANLTHLTTDPQDRLPAWSPDGQRIVFTSDRDHIGNTDIFVINADGTDLLQLTADRAMDDTPFWSPDGRYIAFTSNRDPNTPYGDIYVMRVDGTELQRVTTDPTFENIIYRLSGTDQRRARSGSRRCGNWRADDHYARIIRRVRIRVVVEVSPQMNL